ncbi:hypothetical protein [Devosia sp.]|uniref:hypothetical protein n=1 Tax=Devosia sp. TaxID=1871048 RepID=UPI001AD1DA86|nr:hypothetical protein [Devosia sp.]MBN9332135.1 hypothetical protein [Devosia sp.]
MAETERTYDLLDILRVIKGIWLWVVLVPVLSAIVVGVWASMSSENASLPFRSQAIVRFPTDAFPSGEVERLIQPSGSNVSEQFAQVVLVEEVPGRLAPDYKTLKLTLDSASAAEGDAALEALVHLLAEGVQSFDTQNQLMMRDIADKRELLTNYLAALDEAPSSPQSAEELIARANSAASLVSALGSLDAQLRQVQEVGGGPLVVVSPVDTQPYAAGLQWIRLPIVAAIGGLLAVLFVAFTQDGLRLAAARRRV